MANNWRWTNVRGQKKNLDVGRKIIKPHLKQLSNHLRLTFSFWQFYLGLFPFDPLGRNWVWRRFIVFLGAPFFLSCMGLGLCFCRSLTGLGLCFQTFGNFFCRSLRGNQSNNLTNIHPASTFQWNPLLIDKRLLGSPVHQPHRPYPEMKPEGDVIVDGGVNLVFNRSWHVVGTEFNLLGSRFWRIRVHLKLQSGQFLFIVLWMQRPTHNQNQKQQTTHNQLSLGHVSYFEVLVYQKWWMVRIQNQVWHQFCRWHVVGRGGWDTSVFHQTKMHISKNHWWCSFRIDSKEIECQYWGSWICFCNSSGETASVFTLINSLWPSFSSEQLNCLDSTGLGLFVFGAIPIHRLAKPIAEWMSLEPAPF